MVEPVETTRRLILLRHGRTEWNLDGRAQGHADIELDPVGHAQAAAAAWYLVRLSPVALWSSDLARARQTTAYLEVLTGLSAKYDERLREFDVGEREGMTIPEFAELFPKEHDAWVRGDDTLRMPGAEAPGDVDARISPALRECIDSLDAGETGIVVTHGAALKVGLATLLGWPRSTSVALRGMENCAWATVEELQAGGRIRLAGYNESASLDFASDSPVG